jgi:hypothetical protein
METTTTTTPMMINSLVIDKKMLLYRDSHTLEHFWDMFSEFVSEERIKKELDANTGKYYGNAVQARNTLIRHDLDEAKLYITARDTYAKITCEKILEHFRMGVFSWSTGGKNYALEGTIDAFKKMPLNHLNELYDHENIAEVETLSELIDETLNKMIEEFKSLEAVRACAIFYHERPVFGKNSPIFRDCLNYIADVSRHVRDAGTNEGYFQSAGAQVRQYREMLDPEKTTPEDYRLFLAASDKSTSQIRRDIEETLRQHLNTLVAFEQIQKKSNKNEVRQDLEWFLSNTLYTLESLRLSIAPVYRGIIDKIILRRSAWELREIPVKK